MFKQQVQSCALYPGIDKKVKHGETAEFLICLHSKFSQNRIVDRHIILGKIVKSYSGLQIQRFALEQGTGKIERIAGDEIRYLKKIFSSGNLLVDQGIVESKLAEPEFLSPLHFEVLHAFTGLHRCCLFTAYRRKVQIVIDIIDRQVQIRPPR